MAYLQSLQGQLVVFCRTVGFGFLLGAAYELLHFLRRLLRRRALPWDVGFALPAAVWFFLYALTQNGGRLRVHLLLALATGFAVCLFCVHTPCRRASEVLLRRMQRVHALVRSVNTRMDAAGAKMRRPVRKALKKTVKKNKFPLAIHPRHGV